MTTPSPVEPNYLLVGRILKPHGVRGEVRVVVETEDPRRFKGMTEIHISRRERQTPKPIAIEGVRFHQDKALIKFEGYRNREEAEALRGHFLWVPLEDALPLDDGEFYLYELIGMAVWTEDDRMIGHIKDTIQTGANEVFVVDGGELGEVLIPDTEEVVLEINREARKVLIHPIPGLLSS